MFTEQEQLPLPPYDSLPTRLEGKISIQIFSWGERWNVPFNEAKPS